MLLWCYNPDCLGGPTPLYPVFNNPQLTSSGSSILFQKPSACKLSSRSFHCLAQALLLPGSFHPGFGLPCSGTALQEAFFRLQLLMVLGLNHHQEGLSCLLQALAVHLHVGRLLQALLWHPCHPSVLSWLFLLCFYLVFCLFSGSAFPSCGGPAEAQLSPLAAPLLSPFSG